MAGFRGIRAIALGLAKDPPNPYRNVLLALITLGWFSLIVRPNQALDITPHIAVYAVVNILSAIRVHFWLREVTR
jgi:hypothetical protein